MSFLENLERFKQKKDLVDELVFYESIISKKLTNNNFKSALEKVESALRLIEDNKQDYNIEKELSEFKKLHQIIVSELQNCQKIYYRRYNNLLKENLTESNLENFSKLLAMLKEEVDEYLNKYNLEDLCTNINRYFKFINKLYTIISSYKILNYHGASNKILEFAKELREENFPNIKLLIFSIYQNLLKSQFYGFSKKHEKISITELSNILLIKQESLTNFIDLIIKEPNSPIKKYNITSQEVIFNR